MEGGKEPQVSAAPRVASGGDAPRVKRLRRRRGPGAPTAPLQTSSLLAPVNSRFCRDVCGIEPAAQMPTPADVSSHSSNTLGWPKSSLAFFRTISRKNMNELYGQPNTCAKLLCATVVVEQGPHPHPHLKACPENL